MISNDVTICLKKYFLISKTHVEMFASFNCLCSSFSHVGIGSCLMATVRLSYVPLYTADMEPLPIKLLDNNDRRHDQVESIEIIMDNKTYASLSSNWRRLKSIFTALDIPQRGALSSDVAIFWRIVSNALPTTRSAPLCNVCWKGTSKMPSSSSSKLRTSFTLVWCPC